MIIYQLSWIGLMGGKHPYNILLEYYVSIHEILFNCVFKETNK
jgi:hypothetical protein